MKTLEQEINEATARWGVRHDAVQCPACNGSGEDLYSGDRCGDCCGKGYVIVEVQE